MKKITMLIVALMIASFALAIQAANAADPVKPAEKTESRLGQVCDSLTSETEKARCNTCIKTVQCSKHGVSCDGKGVDKDASKREDGNAKVKAVP